MKKSDLCQQFKVSITQIDALLTAAGIATNLEDYNDEHQKAVETIQSLVETKKANSVKTAGELYRKSLNETQLHEIAMRRSIGDERIPEILSALKLKPENLTEDQFKMFQEACLQLQQGMALEMVAQAALNQPKAAKAKPKPELVQQPELEKTNGSAIAVAAETRLSEVFAQVEDGSETAKNVSGFVVEQLENRSAAEVVQIVTEGLIVLPKTLAQQVEQEMREVVRSESFAKNVSVKVQQLLQKDGVL